METFDAEKTLNQIQEKKKTVNKSLQRIGRVNTILLLFHAIFVISIVVTALGSLDSLDPRKILDSVGRPLPREWSCSNDFDDRSRDKEQGLLFVYLALDIPWIVVSSVLIIYMFLKEKEDTNHQQIESILHGLVIGMIVIAINSLMVVVTSNSLRSLVINCRGFDQTLSLSIAMS